MLQKRPIFVKPKVVKGLTNINRFKTNKRKNSTNSTNS